MPKNIAPDLKRLAEEKGFHIPANLSVQWVTDAGGKPALRVQPTKKDFCVDDDCWLSCPGLSSRMA